LSPPPILPLILSVPHLSAAVVREQDREQTEKLQREELSAVHHTAV
jgi:hypothetical protein